MIDHLNEEEVLRYLGYQNTGVTDRISKLLKRCEQETLQIVSPKYIYKEFPVMHTEEGVVVGQTGLILTGKDIKAHLKNCDSLFLMGVTAGIALDRSIRKYMVTEPDVGIVMDSCGIAVVEQIADLTEKEIENKVHERGMELTWRYSPGYGDLPIECQKKLVQVLDLPRKIGVSLNDSCLMMPSKSVTAILGVTDTKRDHRENKCDFCNNRERCAFRKGGIRC